MEAEMRKIQTKQELKKLVSEMKYSLEGLTRRVRAAGDQISELENDVQKTS